MDFNFISHTYFSNHELIRATLLDLCTTLIAGFFSLHITSSCSSANPSSIRYLQRPQSAAVTATFNMLSRSVHRGASKIQFNLKMDDDSTLCLRCSINLF